MPAPKVDRSLEVYGSAGIVFVILSFLSARTETKLTDWQRNVHGDAKLMIETLQYNGIRPLARGGRLASLSYFTLQTDWYQMILAPKRPQCHSGDFEKELEISVFLTYQAPKSVK